MMGGISILDDSLIVSLVVLILIFFVKDGGVNFIFGSGSGMGIGRSLILEYFDYVFY